MSKNSTRDQGLTSKDDLTVLLGAFDLSSGDDTNRLIQIEFSCSRQERCSTGNWPDCPWGLQQSIVHLERHRPSQARRACWPEHLYPSLPGWPGRRLHWTEWTRLRCFFLHRDPIDRVDFPYHVFWYQVGDLWPLALPRAQMSCRRWRWGFLLGKAIQPLIWKYNSGQHHLGWGVRCSNKRFCYHRGLQWGVHHSGIRKKMIKWWFTTHTSPSPPPTRAWSLRTWSALEPLARTAARHCHQFSNITIFFVKISCKIISKKIRATAAGLSLWRMRKQTNTILSESSAGEWDALRWDFSCIMMEINRGSVIMIIRDALIQNWDFVSSLY